MDRIRVRREEGGRIEKEEEEGKERGREREVCVYKCVHVCVCAYNYMCVHVGNGVEQGECRH